MKEKEENNLPIGKFIKQKTYAIGALQRNSLPDEAPARFSSNPVPPIYITGGELHARKIRNVYDFLKNNCPFKVGSTVHFYEVIYSDEKQELSHFFSGTVLQPLPNNSLSDDEISPITSNSEKNNITLVNPVTDGNSKIFAKSQAEQILLLTKQCGDERANFDKERKEYLRKIDELNAEKVNLNIEINTIEAEKRAMEIRYEETQKMFERLVNNQETNEQKANDIEQSGSLADKGIAAIDTMLGDGASSQIINGIATGLGEGISKLLDFGINFANKKLNLKTETPANTSIVSNYDEQVKDNLAAENKQATENEATVSIEDLLK